MTWERMTMNKMYDLTVWILVIDLNRTWAWKEYPVPLLLGTSNSNNNNKIPLLLRFSMKEVLGF